MKKIKKENKLVINISLIIISIVAIAIIIFAFMYKTNTEPVNDSKVIKHFEVVEGSSYLGLADQLQKEGLIKSEFFYKLFLRLNQPKLELEPGIYNLYSAMDVKEIVTALGNGSNKRKTVVVTFREGLHMRDYAKLIANFSGFSEEEVMAFQSKEAYLDQLIENYWFFTDEIKNKEIYYPLEGYLFPETYEFYIDATLEEIFETFLNEAKNNLDPIKEKIKVSDFTVHEFLTLASITELEASSDGDREGATGVFMNRLESEWPLGSDVTTYYAEKLELFSRDLTMEEINSVNAYNTRPQASAGNLPIGPICNPGLKSYNAVANYTKHKYYYFVADINGKTHFSKTLAEHNQLVDDLKEAGLWFEH